MDVGIQMIFQKFGYGDDMTDSRIYDEEVALGVLADELGYDALWPVEHHFEDYSFCPDNTQFLSYMAARTQRIKLGTGAVILPWHDPLRVAEKISLLDQLNGGRTLFGMGRGLSRREYEPFGLDMSTSRERFDEASRMILDALETGFIEGEGTYYKQPRTAIRPRPSRTFKGRITAVAMSPDSVKQAARLGARMVIFSQKAWEEQKTIFDYIKASGNDVNLWIVGDPEDPSINAYMSAGENAQGVVTPTEAGIQLYVSKYFDKASRRGILLEELEAAEEVVAGKKKLLEDL